MQKIPGPNLTPGYLLSPRDLCGLEFIPELIKAGVTSLKIEGRMKSPEYVATVTRIYRKYIDLAYDNSKPYVIYEKDKQDLMQVFNRGGFSSGHLSNEKNDKLVFEKRQNNMGIYLGKISKYNPSKLIIDKVSELTILPGTIFLCNSAILEYGIIELYSKLPENCLMILCEFDNELHKLMKGTFEQVKNKIKACEYTGITSKLINVDSTITETELLNIVNDLNKCKSYDVKAILNILNNIAEQVNCAAINGVFTKMFKNAYRLSGSQKPIKEYEDRIENLYNALLFGSNKTNPIDIPLAYQKFELVKTLNTIALQYERLDTADVPSMIKAYYNASLKTLKEYAI